MNKADLEKLESYWINIKKIKQQLKFREWELLYEHKEQDENIGGGRSGNISDTTFVKAEKLAEDKLYQNLKLTINTIDKLYQDVDEETKEIIHLRYWEQDHYDWEDIAHEIGITRSKVFSKRNILIDATKERLGWI